MSNTSEREGFLESSPVQGKEDLGDVFHDLIAGITGLPGESVRPTSQLHGVKVPGAGVNWCAFDVRRRGAAGGTAEVIHRPEDDGHDGHDELIRHKPVEVQVSFYGPGASDLADALVDGIEVAQNRKILRDNNIGFVSAGPQRDMPENRNAGWLARTDLTLIFNRQVSREYAVRNIESAQGGITTDAHGGPNARINVQE